MTVRFVVSACLSAVVLATGLHAQTTTTKTKENAGPAKVEKSTLSGEVALTEGNQLLVRMKQNGLYRYFSLKPGQQFQIDGQPKLIGDLKPGTTLTATIFTTTQPVTVRTTSVLNGTVWYVSGNYVVLTHEDGVSHEYNVPPSFKFMVEGKPASVGELRKGMKVSATKIVEEPHTEISTDGYITGKAPK
jgi:hypothetical protein